MKFYSAAHQLLATDPLLEEDYRNAISISPLRIGERNLFWRVGLKTVCLPYADIRRVYRRIRAMHTSLGCCGGDLNLDYLVLCGEDSELAEIEFSNENFTKAAMDRLHSLLPDAQWGVEKE